jgi:hypothetical protein
MLLLASAGCREQPSGLADVCPARAQTVLRSVDVFDGPPESLATLVPDAQGEQQGHWQLGYVYDANRFVTVRCKYADGQTTDVKLDKRVDRCDYTIDAQKTLTVKCK